MSKFKKSVSFAIALGLAISACTVNAFAEDTSIEEELRNQVLAEYADDNMFRQMISSDPEAAEEYISNEVIKRSLPQPHSSSGSTAYCSVPLIRQSATNYCGYAAELMALYGFGKGSSVSGSTYSKQQATLAKMQDSSGTEDAVVWKIARDLNKYITDTRTYSYTQGTQLTETTFKSKTYNSLHYNRPVILHAMTGSLSYYQGVNLRHYLVVDQIDNQLNSVEIVDSHWDTSATYYGRHTESVSNAFETINISGRYLISL